MRLRKKIAAGFLTAAVMATTSMTASADRLPQAYGQNKDTWCWAAAAKMVGENNGGKGLSIDPVIPTDKNNLHKANGVEYWGITTVTEGGKTVEKVTVDGVQHYIVTRIKNTDKGDKTAISYEDSDKEMAIALAADEDVDVVTYGNMRSALTSSQLADIQFILRQGYYVLVNMYNSSYTSGHTAVIKGYNASNNTYRVFDPWDLTDESYPSNMIFSQYGFYCGGIYYRLETYTSCLP